MICWSYPAKGLGLCHSLKGLGRWHSLALPRASMQRKGLELRSVFYAKNPARAKILGIGPPAFPAGIVLALRAAHSLTLPRGPVRAGCYADGMFYGRLEQFSHTAQIPAASMAFSVYHIARARISGIGPPAFPLSSPEGPCRECSSCAFGTAGCFRLSLRLSKLS